MQELVLAVLKYMCCYAHVHENWSSLPSSTTDNENSILFLLQELNFAILLKSQIGDINSTQKFPFLQYSVWVYWTSNIRFYIFRLAWVWKILRVYMYLSFFWSLFLSFVHSFICSSLFSKAFMISATFQTGFHFNLSPGITRFQIF